ncbi:MAG: cyclase family protein [Burkholderiaceae bacterium]
MMRVSKLLSTLPALAFAFAGAPLQATEPASLLTKTSKRIPAPPWAKGDQKGMGNTQGAGTWARCAWHLAQPGAKVYEVSQIRSNTMPKSPFSGPHMVKPKPVAGLPFTAHAFNGEVLNEGAEPNQQGTQIDALGHFASLAAPWDGKADFPGDTAVYYGGFLGKDVKPTPDSPLLKLGMEQVPPIVSSAVLLDAKAHVGKGRALKAGAVVTQAHVIEMLKAQGLGKRGIQPGDVVYIYTGWSDQWQDPDIDKTYYAAGPGLGYDAAQYLGRMRVVAIGMDVPFIDPVAEGMLAGKAPPAPGTPPGLPFAVHHHMLTQAGIYHLESVRLAEMAKDKVWTSCTMVLPLRERGSAGSPIRPVAIGKGAAR